MAFTLQHRDYIANVDFDPEIDLFHGRIVNIRDVITFYGSSIEELKQEFAASLQVYLDVCREKGIEPAKPFSGRFNLRLTPESHAKATAAALASGKSLNAFIAETVEEKAEKVLHTVC